MKHYKHKYKQKPAKGHIWQTLPVILMISLVPLLVRARYYVTGLEDFPWFDTRTQDIDLFLKIKQEAIIAIGLVMVVVLAYYWLTALASKDSRYSDGFLKDRGKWKWEGAFYPLLAYMALALLSTLFSPYAQYGYRGAHEQFESLFVLLTYGVIVLYTFWALASEVALQKVEMGFLLGVSLLCLLGVLQITGHDLFRTSLGARLILSDSLFQAVGGNLSFKFPLTQVYLSLYNPNYVGMYVSLVLPVIMALFISKPSLKLRIWYGLLMAGLLLCLVGSGSRTAFVLLLFSLVLLLVFFRKKLLQNKLVTILGLATAGALVVAAILFMGNSFFDRLKAGLQFSANPAYDLSYIQDKADRISLTYKGEGVDLIADPQAPGGFRLEKLGGQEIPSAYRPDHDIYYFTGSLFAETPLLVTDRREDQVDLQWQINGIGWDFRYRDQQFYFLTPSGKEDHIREPEKGWFQNQESFATYRGYIWSRTLPLVKKYIFLGSGADTFTLVFPQDDYLGKVHNSFHNVLITKPHNLYLQMAVQTGLLSMLAFLVFYGLYFISSLKLYWHHSFDTDRSRLGVAVFIGSMGYMVSSIFNDSIIAVSPVFWVLLGIGFACNWQEKKSGQVAAKEE